MISVEHLEEALGTLLHHLFELVSALALFRGVIGGLHQTQLVHEEGIGADFDGLGIGDDLSDDAGGLVLLRESEDLLEALLDEAGEVDDGAIATTLNLVVLEQNVGAEQVDCLVDDVVGRSIRVVGVFS